MMYPIPYADPEAAVDLAVQAERMGFDSVWGNDHISTQSYVRAEFPDPPRFYDPYLYLSYVGARTTTLRLATAITVMAFRHPVVVAKQAATLDQLTGGRFMLGVGIGAYREEIDAMWPQHGLHRGRHAEEFFKSINVLLRERRASYSGEFISFTDVESFPKPVQNPLPLLSGGNASGSKERAARFGNGWLPACLTPSEISDGVAEIRAVAEQSGRVLPADFDVAPQLAVALGRTREEALKTFEESQIFTHMRSLSESTLKGRQADLTERNLIGSPDDVLEQVQRYADAGATTLSALLFAANDVPQTLEQMQEFSESIIAVVNKTASTEEEQRAQDDGTGDGNV
jgi:probable F420-dependent oxidoreductase